MGCLLNCEGGSTLDWSPSAGFFFNQGHDPHEQTNQIPSRPAKKNPISIPLLSMHMATPHMLVDSSAIKAPPEAAMEDPCALRPPLLILLNLSLSSMAARLLPLTMRFSSFALDVAKQATVCLHGRQSRRLHAGRWVREIGGAATGRAG